MTETVKTRAQPGWPVDGHVHFHRPERVPETLDAAAENFRKVSGRSSGLLGALLLTQAAGERVFEHMAARQSLAHWAFEPVASEPQSLIARKGGAAVAVICGRQVRAQHGLEVLGLGTLQEFPDGESLADTVAAVTASGALVALPWGFGKWWGDRGRLVDQTLRSAGARRLSVGDNGGRLALLAPPARITEFAREGFRVIPGTDPFPFARDYRRAGGFGFFAGVAAEETAPWGTLRAWLEALTESPPSFGKACGPIRFVANQVGIQFYNRFFRSATR